MTRYLSGLIFSFAVLFFAMELRAEEEAIDTLSIGSTLNDPITPALDYPGLVEVTVDENPALAQGDYKKDIDAYVKSRRSARGRVFEALVAYQANQQYERENNSTRVLVVAVELADEKDKAEKHPADNLLWRDKKIQKRYQVKSYKNASDATAFVTQPKWMELYKDEIIVIHPEKLAEIRDQLAEQRKKSKPLSPRWQKVAAAIDGGRLTDEVKPGLKVPSLIETQKATDRFLRRIFIRSREVQAG
ncbi:MAG: hypothetical protein P8K78_04585 [Pirellulales bacterium]|nr:hypothetical protein [Pirellulales bacterium]